MVRLTMTEEGRNALASAEEILMEQASRQVRNLSIDDLASMYDLLTKMAQSDGADLMDALF